MSLITTSNVNISIFDSTINSEIVKTINARDLHCFLDVGKDFSNWIKGRIDQYNFIENQDFTVVTQSVVSPKGGRPIIDYNISLDMAKIIAASENNNKGRMFLSYILKNSIITAEELFDIIMDVDNPTSEEMFVYAIQEFESGKLKIGISANPNTRLKQLQVGNPNKLRIVAIRKAPNRFHTEKQFHKNAEKYHIRGEWFNPEAITTIN
jgi:phage anti-repressor protein